MAVEYKNNNISINLSNSNRDKSITVYAHPDDRLSFNVDISNLTKEVKKGDLIIHLLNGNTVTVVNFGLMSLDNKAPILVDSTGTEYDPLSLFQGTAYYSSSGVKSYVVSRKDSSPEDNSSVSGDKYRTAKDLQDGSGLDSSKSGYFPVEDQNPVPEFGPSFEDYATKTLMNLGQKKYTSPTDFSSTKGFKYTDKSDDTKPVKLLIINPKLDPQYGAHYSFENGTQQATKANFKVDLGGGSLSGVDYASYQYKPEKIEIANDIGKGVLFDGTTQGDIITRYVKIYIDNKLVRFTGLELEGLPNGVTIPSGNIGNLSVTPYGGGSYQIDINGGAANGEVRVPIQYRVGSIDDTNLFAAIDVTYEGVLTSTDDIVRGSSVFYFNFLPVLGEDDIQGVYNNYTFSTLRDPLEIVFPNYDNEIRGGKGKYTYVGGTADDTGVGGEATETFNLGDGNNTFYAGVYDDTVTNSAPSPNIQNKLYLSDAINSADTESTKVAIEDGLVYFSGTRSGGTSFKSNMSNFTDIYLDENRFGKATERDDYIDIKSTANFTSDVAVHFGDGNNTVNLGKDTGFDISFSKDTSKIAASDGFPVTVSTKNTLAKVLLDWNSTKNGVNWIIGSKPGDEITFIDGAIGINYDGSGSTKSVADYSNLMQAQSLEFNFDAATFEVSRFLSTGSSTKDTLLGIKQITGSQSQNNVFFGALTYQDRNGNTQYSSIAYIGGNQDKSLNKLTYEKMPSSNTEDILNNGVIIDMEEGIVTKKGNPNYKDTFSNIGTVVASDNNDEIIAANSYYSSSLDGKGGDNTINYKNFSSNIKIDISSFHGNSTVYKRDSNSGQDSLSNFNYFVGSAAETNFVLEDADYDASKSAGSKRYDLDGGKSDITNSVSYVNVRTQNMILDLLDIDINNKAIKASTLDSSGNELFYDYLYNITSFILSSQSSNTIYMYKQQQLGSLTINAGNNATSNLISFEKSNVSVSLDFKNENYTNINNVNKLVLSNYNDTVVMGYNFFAQEIDGGEGVNKIDLSIITSSIVQQFNLDNVGIDKLNLSGTLVDVKHFQQVVSGSGDDIYKIKADLDNIDNYAKEKFFIDASVGNSTINFNEISIVSSSSNAEGLYIDLSQYSTDKAFVKYLNKELISFKNFSTIIGSDYDDTFVLPDYDFIFKIDGGRGTNTVSYQSYNSGVFITKDTLLNFTNIQRIIGSKGDDRISIDETSALNFDGGNYGFNTALYSGVFRNTKEIVVNYSGKAQATVTKGSNVDNLTNVQYFNFKGILDGGNLQMITVNIKDPTNGDTPVFFSAPVNKNLTNGGQAFLEYSSANSFDNSMKLSLSLHPSRVPEGNWISLKGLDADDGSINFQNFSKLTMTGYMDVAITDYTSLIGSLQDITSLTIDNTKELHNGLDLTDKAGDVTIKDNLFKESYNNGSGKNFDLNVNKIGKITGSNDYNSTLNYVAGDPNYTSADSQVVIIVAGMGKTYIDYRNVKGDIDITLGDKTKQGNKVTTVEASSSGNKVQVNEIYGDVTKYDLSDSFKNTIKFSLDENVDGVIFDASSSSASSNNNSIDYSGATVPTSTYNFIITGEGNISVNRYYGNNIDQYINFYDATLNFGSSKVTFDDTLKNTNTVYNIRMDGVSSSTTHNSKNAEFDLSSLSDDLNFKMTDSSSKGLLNIISGGSIRASLSFDTSSHLDRNDIILKGSLTNANTFTVGNFFNGVFNNSTSQVFSLTVQGNSVSSINNVLDLTDCKEALNLSAIDGLISRAVANSSLFINAQNGIQIIKLGDGDNILDISSNAIVNWSTIIGGSGNNSVSFENLQAPIQYDLAAGISSGTITLALTNFNGIIGTQFNDTFSLQDADSNHKGVSIDGGGGSKDTLDYSNLRIGFEVNIIAGTVTRKASSGHKVDSVKNIDVFMGGTGGTTFISNSSSGSNTFVGNSLAIAKSKDNILSYEGVANERLVFNFISNSVTKVNGDYDSFSNINKFYGGIGQNIFMYSTDLFKQVSINDVHFYGNAKASENTLDFSQDEYRKNGSTNITFDMSVNSIVKGGITIHIDNIYSIVGTRGSDVYKFANGIGGYTVSGLNNDIGEIDTVNLANITSKVTVDFSDSTITYDKSGTTNHFVGIDRFIGTNNNENDFLNLEYFPQYEISVFGTKYKSNKVTYKQDIPLGMEIRFNPAEPGQFYVAKSSNGKQPDKFINIQDITLGNGSNILTLNSEQAMNYLLNNMKINLGNGGNNTMQIIELQGTTVKSLVIDLQNSNLNLNSTKYTLTGIDNFNSIFVGSFQTLYNKSVQVEIKFGIAFKNIKEIDFGSTTKYLGGKLNLSNVKSDLSISIGSDKDVTFNSMQDSAVLKVRYLSEVILGSQNFNINYTSFGNSIAGSALKIKTDNAVSTTVNLLTLYSDVNSINVTQSKNLFSINATSAAGTNLVSQEYSVVNRLNIKESPSDFTFSSDLSKDFYLYFNAANTQSISINLDIKNSGVWPPAITFTMNSLISRISDGSSTLTSEMVNVTQSDVNVNLSSKNLTINFNEVPQIITKYNIQAAQATTFSIDFSLLNTIEGRTKIILGSNGSGVKVAVDIVSSSGVSEDILNVNLKAGTVPDIHLSQKNNNTIEGNDNASFAKLYGTISNIYQNQVVMTFGSISQTERGLLDTSGVKIWYPNILSLQHILSFLENNSTNDPSISSVKFVDSSETNVKFIEVSVYKGLKYVDFGKVGKNFSRVDTVDFDTNKQANVVGNILLGPDGASGTFKGETELEFENFNYFTDISNSYKSKIILSGVSGSIDNISISLSRGYSSMYNLFQSLPSVYIDIGYKSYDTARSSFLDLSNIKISSAESENAVVYISNRSGNGMEFTLANDNSATTLSASKTKILLDQFYKLAMQITYATSNHNGAVVDYDAQAYYGHITQSVNLGDMDSMRLPNSYTLFMGNTSYSWTRPNSKSELDNYKNYQGYYNIFRFTGNFYGNNTIIGDLFRDNSNRSEFSINQNSPYSIRGINLIWGSESASTHISINKVESAHTFAVLLYEDANNNSIKISNDIDFNNLSDTGSYRFYMGQGNDKYLRGTGLQAVISKSNSINYKDNGQIPIATDIYGTISGFTHLTLTFGNDTIIPVFNTTAGNITNSDRYVIDGSGGVNTINLYSDDVKNDTVEFKTDNAGNAGIIYNNITYTNFKEIITPQLGAQGEHITYKAYYDGHSWPEHSVHNFVIKKYIDSSYKDIHFVAEHFSSAIYSKDLLFFNNANLLITKNDTIPDNPTFLFDNVNVSNITVPSTDILLGNTIDFAAISSGKGNTFNIDLNLTSTSPSLDLFVYYSGTRAGSNYNVYEDNSGNKHDLVITSLDTQYSITISCARRVNFKLSEIYPDVVSSHNPFSQNTLDYLYGLSDEATNLETDVDYSGSSKFNSEGYKFNTSNDGSKNIVWQSENKYIEHNNHYYANSDYWKNLDSHIESVTANKEDSKPYINAFLEEFNKQQNGKVQNASDNNENTNNDSKDTIKQDKDSNTIHNSNHVDLASDNNENTNNDSKDTIKQDKDSNTIHNSNHFDLNAILQVAKELHTDSYKDDNNFIEHLGFKNISHDVLENTYRQDEANSMGYTIDTNYNYHDSYGEQTSGCSNHDNQKNKIDHH